MIFFYLTNEIKYYLNALFDQTLLCKSNGSKSMFGKITAVLKDESGATAIEYGLIAALVSVAAIAALTAMGTSLEQMFTKVSDELSNAVNASATST
jgi:pilus assembly protein Flp/PilA